MLGMTKESTAYTARFDYIKNLFVGQEIPSIFCREPYKGVIEKLELFDQKHYIYFKFPDESRLKIERTPFTTKVDVVD